MRPRRPYVTTLADVTINRSGESAVITYGGPAVHPVVFAIGPDIDRCSDAEILARFNDSLHAARAQTEGRQHVVVEIPRGHAQLDYFAPAGQWVPRNSSRFPVWRVTPPAVHREPTFRRGHDERSDPAASHRRPPVRPR